MIHDAVDFTYIYRYSTRHLQTLQAGAMAVQGSDQIELANCDSDNSNKENDPLLVIQENYGTFVLPSKSCTPGTYYVGGEVHGII